jgi:hypothetical protein
MATVIEYDVDVWVPFPEDLPERGISLITDLDPDSLVLVHPACFDDIDSRDSGSRPEIVAPHSQAAAAENTDFHEVNLLPDEAGKVTMVHLEIVLPLPDSSPFGVSIEIGLQGVERIRLGGGC